MHLIYLFQSVFMSTSHIIMHETAIYGNRVNSLIENITETFKIEGS